MNILEARRRTLGGHILKKTAQGNPAIATDSLARMYPGIEMQGWTEQDSTTGAQLFDASKIPSASAGGATLVNNGDGSFTISGEGKLVSPFSSMVNLSHDETVAILRAGDLYINAGQSGEPYLTVSIQNDSESIKKTFSSSGSATGKINVTEDDLADEEIYLRYGFYGRAGGTISNHTISPMLYQSGSGTWEPYTGGQPSPSPDYPQEIVSAGKYNEDTKKWEYEITITNAQTDPDKNQTVTLTADRPLTKWDRLEKRGGQWGWVYKSEEIESYTDGGVPGEYFSTTGQLSVGAQVWYETATETFVPLSESEQEAMNSLYTYRPTTVLTNQQGCQMALTYKTRKGMS